MRHRYIIVLDRDYDEDVVADHDSQDLRDPEDDAEGIAQVTRELQEAANDTGLPVGQFRVIARGTADDESVMIGYPVEQAIAAAIRVLNK